MRFLFSLLLVAALAYGAWPYLHVYRLDTAVAEDNTGTIRALVDLEAVQRHRTAQLEWHLENRIDNTVGQEGTLSDMVKRGARWVRDRGGSGDIDPVWVRQRLLEARVNDVSGLLQSIDFAFFEGPNQFLVRLGELGEGPTHLRFERREWRWYLTGIYD
ncbi:MAG: DUF2939 domain-containing protein [Gammaproteobacteria bacterium]|nr:DUF2939 domain-containing protein [Gammaproteobacteria bacterium]